MSLLLSVIPKTGIKVSFFDTDGKKVSGITVDQANQVAKNYPDKRFYFQNGDGTEKELTIEQVNDLLPTDLLPTAPKCPTGPQVCGPPLVKFFGGGGYGAAANAIISPISTSVIGFDITNSGFGFFDSPSAQLIDPCGNGSGASLQVNMEDDEENTSGEGDGFSLLEMSTQDFTNANTTTITNEAVGTNNNATTITNGTVGANNNPKTGITSCEAPIMVFEKSVNKFRNRSKKIKNITIKSPGDGYLTTPDGSLGGNERVWKEPDEGFVQTKCGNYYLVQPYRPIKVNKGDTYYPPNDLPRVLKEDEIITLPLVPVIPPKPENLGVPYSVVLTIDEIKVLDPGFGYRPGDKLIIDPDNGATADLVINDNGQVVGVEVTNSGIGFLDLPNLRTNSSSGFNATFSTIFKPIRIDITKPIEEQLGPVVTDQIELITVIDCVGRVI